MEQSLYCKGKNDQVNSFLYELTNTTDQVITLTFSSSQRYDYTIYNSSGEIVKTYSDNLFFLTVLGEVRIFPNKSLTYSFQVKDLPIGEYEIVFWLVATNIGLETVACKFIV